MADLITSADGKYSLYIFNKSYCYVKDDTNMVLIFDLCTCYVNMSHICDILKLDFKSWFKSEDYSRILHIARRQINQRKSIIYRPHNTPKNLTLYFASNHPIIRGYYVHVYILWMSNKFIKDEALQRCLYLMSAHFILTRNKQYESKELEDMPRLDPKCPIFVTMIDYDHGCSSRYKDEDDDELNDGIEQDLKLIN